MSRVKTLAARTTTARRFRRHHRRRYRRSGRRWNAHDFLICTSPPEKKNVVSFDNERRNEENVKTFHLQRQSGGFI